MDAYFFTFFKPENRRIAQFNRRNNPMTEILCLFLTLDFIVQQGNKLQL